jgi:hypothetical protein
MTVTDLENAIAGCVLALLCGMAGDAPQRVSEALKIFAADRHTPLSEAQFYRDLAESIAMTPQLPEAWGVFAQLETLH